MYPQHSRRERNRHLSAPIVMIVLIVASIPLFGGAFGTAVAREVESCVYYEGPNGRPVVDSTCLDAIAEEAQEWPDYDSTAIGHQVIASRMAAEEAAGWEDFDSTAIGDRVIASRAAAEEAAGWSDFDSTAIGDQVIAAREAEVAGVPQFQSTSAL